MYWWNHAAELVARGKVHRFNTVTSEHDEGTDGYSVELLRKTGPISADLTIGPDVASTVALRANENLSSREIQLIGSGFMCTRPQFEGSIL